MVVLKSEENAGEEGFTKEHLAKLTSQLEKNIIQNQELRTKYAKNPEKFMESEVDLDEDVRENCCFKRNFSCRFGNSELWQLIQNSYQISLLQMSDIYLLLFHIRSKKGPEKSDFFADT